VGTEGLGQLAKEYGVVRARSVMCRSDEDIFNTHSNTARSSLAGRSLGHDVLSNTNVMLATGEQSPALTMIGAPPRN
jgi:hypothetical protein